MTSTLPSHHPRHEKPYLINTHKVTSERKDATNLLKIVEEEIRFFVNVLRIIVVAWCTDASGESAKMRRMLRDKMPWIFVIDCWAHQMNLVVGDIFKTIGTSFASVVDDALDIVKWFNNHTLALGLLKDIQFTQLKKVLCLILPVITRWTTHYQAVRRLLELQTPLRTLLLLEKEKLIASVGKQGEAQARDIVEKLERPGFWEDLSEVKRHLEPLAAATNILQSDRARLDTVLIILANLFHIFSDDSLSLEICRSVLRILEKRWAKQDQDIIILATVLNPFIRVNTFSPSSIYRKPAKIIELASAAYRRFFGKDPNFEFKKSVTDYLNRHDRWSDQDMGLADFRKADKDMATADLVEIWRRLLPVPDACSPTDPPPPPPDGADGLAYLGAYLMSITPNTASTEREFSKFGIIHTPLRNRLSHDTVRKMTMVNHDTAQKYPMPSRGESKRKHGEEEPSRSEPQSTQGQQTDDSSAHDSVDPLSQTFNDVALNLMVEADDAPGVSDEVLDSMEAPEDLPSNTTPSQPSLSIRITIPPELSEKRAKMLRNLFSFPSRTSSFSAKASFTVLDAFWEVANDDLTREQVLHETVCG
ncbi:ribonuclease H-like domain-containing protein, partial [Amylostereum chailletii]